MTDQNQDEKNSRIPFWSILLSDRLKFSYCFFALFVTGLSFIVAYEILKNDCSAWEIILNIGKAVTPIGLFAFTITFAIFEGRDTMSSALEYFLGKREEKGRQEGLEQGRQEVLDAVAKSLPNVDLEALKKALTDDK